MHGSELSPAGLESETVNSAGSSTFDWAFGLLLVAVQGAWLAGLGAGAWWLLQALR